MSDDAVDKSLLARLQALRGGKREAQENGPAAAPGIKFDPIERRSAESPTGNDILAARLKSLRAQAESDSPKPGIRTITAVSSTPRLSKSTVTQDEVGAVEDDEDETFLVTDDAALEEMLAEPHSDDEDVVALLEELTASIPADTDAVEEEEEEGGEGGRDGLEVESNFEMPSIPDTLPSALHKKSDSGDADLDDLTARMAALRSDLPSVPASKPARVNRLTSKTGYTDSDMDSWCIVCLEDATLRCLGCDDDAYCYRCWKEMHVGPAAYFDDRSHRAVQFTRDRKKVALGA